MVSTREANASLDNEERIEVPTNRRSPALLEHSPVTKEIDGSNAGEP
jgi:hypothetical protein